MSEWLDNQKKQSSKISEFLEEQIEKAKPCRKLTVEETNRLHKLEGIADKRKRGENVQNRQLQTWLSEEKYEQLEDEKQQQLERRKTLRTKSQCSMLYHTSLGDYCSEINHCITGILYTNLLKKCVYITADFAARCC